MAEDGEYFMYLLIGLLLIAIANVTIKETGISIPLYIGLVIITSELIYIQILALENKNFYESLKTTEDYMHKAHNYKLIAILLAIILIPTITVSLYFIYAILVFIKVIIYIIAIITGAVSVWLAYIFINSIPMRILKKKFEKNKKLEEDSSKHPGPALD